MPGTPKNSLQQNPAPRRATRKRGAEPGPSGSEPAWRLKSHGHPERTHGMTPDTGERKQKKKPERSARTLHLLQQSAPAEVAHAKSRKHQGTSSRRSFGSLMCSVDCVIVIRAPHLFRRNKASRRSRNLVHCFRTRQCAAVLPAGNRALRHIDPLPERLQRQPIVIAILCKRVCHDAMFSIWKPFCQSLLSCWFPNWMTKLPPVSAIFGK